MLIHLVHETVKDLNLYTHQPVMLSLEFPDSRIRNIVLKGPKYRFPSQIDFNRCGEEIASALMILVIDGVNERVLSVML